MKTQNEGDEGPLYDSDPYIDTMAVNACVAGGGKGRLIFTIRAARNFARDVLRAQADGAFAPMEAEEPSLKPGKNCQSGYPDICAAAKFDGVVCPDGSCDIDRGLRCTKSAAAQPSRAEVLEEAAKLCDQAFENVAPGHGGSYEEGCRDAFDLAGSQIRALKDQK
jgi:hypothetical protein